MLKATFFLLILIVFVQIAEGVQQKNQIMQLSLFTEKFNYYVAEPVFVTTILQSNQEKTVMGNFDDITIYYRKVENDFAPYLKTNDVFTSNRFIEIEPNGSVERRKYLLYDTYAKHFVLNEPGTYEFKANVRIELSNSKQVICVSNIIQVTVTSPPKGEENALNDFQNHQIGLLLNGLDFRQEYVDLDDLLEKAAMFIENHGSSFYTPMVVKQLKVTLNEIKKQNDGNLSPKLEAIHNIVESFPN